MSRKHPSENKTNVKVSQQFPLNARKKNVAAAIISLNFKLAFCPIIWLPEDLHCEQNFKQAERTFEDPGVCTLQVTAMGRHYLTPGRRTLPPAKGLLHLDVWVFPSVFKAVSVFYKPLEHFKSPSSTNSKRNPGNKQMNKNILHFHVKHLDLAGAEAHTPQRINWNNQRAWFNLFRSFQINTRL